MVIDGIYIKGSVQKMKRIVRPESRHYFAQVFYGGKAHQKCFYKYSDAVEWLRELYEQHDRPHKSVGGRPRKNPRVTPHIEQPESYVTGQSPLCGLLAAFRSKEAS